MATFLGLKCSHTCPFIWLNLNVGSWSCINGFTKNLFNPFHMFNTEQGPEDTTGHKMQPLPSGGSHSKQVWKQAVTDVCRSSCYSRTWQPTRALKPSLGLHREAVVLAEVEGQRLEKAVGAFRITFLSITSPGLEVLLSRTCLSEGANRDHVGFWGTPRVEDGWVSRTMLQSGRRPQQQ